jgi:hypothetical protein
MAELAIYRIDVFDELGIKRGSLTGNAAGGSERSGFLSFACQRRRNAPGLLAITLRGDHALLLELADKWQFELWRRPTGQDWVREFVGIFRAGQWSWAEKSTIVLYCPGILSLLNMRVINYPATTVDRTVYEGVPAETIAKSMVTYNITSAATIANGRKRDGTNWPASQISVEADAASGTVLQWYCFGQYLLDGLQKLASVGGGDFDLVKTGSQAYEFRWYEEQLGVMTNVKFSLTLGNMGTPQVDQIWTNERTVACVWGQGDDDTRDYTTRYGRNYATDNDIEMFVNASSVSKDDVSGLENQGDRDLSEQEAQRVFKFASLQAPATLYGIHYQLGDLVTVIDPLNGAEYLQVVDAISLTWDSDGKQGTGIELAAAPVQTGS